MTNLPKTLPTVGSLLSDSWKLFTSTWNVSVKTSILFLYVGLVYFASGFLAKYNPNFSTLVFIVSLASGIFTAWVGIRLMIRMLLLEAGKSPLDAKEEGQKAMGLFVSLIWIGLLVGIITFGATILFILPGIYFGVALYFSELFLIDKGIRGSSALKESRELIKGRWWATFGRVISGVVLFAGLMTLIAGFVMLLIGPLFKLRMMGYTVDLKTDPFYAGVAQFVQMAAMAAFMPLIIGFQVKLYRQLQRSR